MQVHFFIVGFGDDPVIPNSKSHVQEVDQRGRSNRFDVPFQYSKVVDVFFEYCPVCCQIACPDAEDIVNEAFVVQQISSMFWKKGVYFVVSIVEGFPHHGS